MSRWIDGRPGMWYGFTDLGPIQIPVVPQFIMMTDRADGVTLWWLTFDTTVSYPDGLGTIAVTTTSPPFGFPYQTFGPYDGPYLNGDAGFAKLFVRGGTLGVDEEPTPVGLEDIEGLQVYARQAGLNIPMRQIILGGSDSLGNLYGWVPYTYVQTPNPICPPPCT
jgi:hypothetical protein